MRVPCRGGWLSLQAQRRPAVEVLDHDEGDGDAVVDMIVGSYIAQFARRGSVGTDWTDRVVAVLGRDG
ncbi:hypothetical protein [Mycobacterium sp. ACS4331]|uniref:hypothetical protein n=1 Tax=Mycobacterium sp. ACS4331 TaxID=1834121 RepID=UPI0008001DD9|nr:hypothetical protein [Mycobacterium sp. ACS4331]OBF12040.1 hypothetical protein A5727_18640 [Mycobacterium sp. ACS4331]